MTTDEPHNDSTPGSPPRPAPAAGMKDYAKHALWIYGVIVGLAFREAIMRTFTHDRSETPTANYHGFLELMRFLMFYFVASTFYLGAAHFFEDVHGPGSNINFAPTRKRFGLDFMLGLIHFTFFFGWAMYLPSHSTWIFGLSPSLAWMAVILVYDAIWFIISLDLCTRNLIGKWTGLSTLAITLASAGFVVIRALYEAVNKVWGVRIDVIDAATSAELTAIGCAAWIMAYDFRSLIHGDAILPKWMRKFVSMFEDDALDPSA